MSHDEQMATLIRDALSTTIEDASDDPDAIDRVGHGVGAALGETEPDPDPEAETKTETRAAEPRRAVRVDPGRDVDGGDQER